MVNLSLGGRIESLKNTVYPSIIFCQSWDKNKKIESLYRYKEHIREGIKKSTDFDKKDDLYRSLSCVYFEGLDKLRELNGLTEEEIRECEKKVDEEMKNLSEDKREEPEICMDVSTRYTIAHLKVLSIYGQSNLKYALKELEEREKRLDKEQNPKIKEGVSNYIENLREEFLKLRAQKFGIEI
jgi:hypothetical protein